MLIAIGLLLLIVAFAVAVPLSVSLWAVIVSFWSVFIARTDTGRINVPKTVTGGKCEITTDTGNIIISVQ